MPEEKQVGPLHSTIVDVENAKVLGIRHTLSVFLDVNAETFEGIQTPMEIREVGILEPTWLAGG